MKLRAEGPVSKQVWNGEVLAAENAQLRAALSGLVCAECRHILGRHLGQLDDGTPTGCDHTFTDGGAECGCQGEEFTEVAQAVKALRECGDSK